MIDRLSSQDSLDRLSPSGVPGRLGPQDALDRLIAGAWDPEGLPPAERVPWEQVVPLARATDTGSFLHIAAQSLRASMPVAARRFFEDAYYFQVAEGARAEQQLAEVGRVLSGTGAPLLLLKGAALAESVYRSFALRLMGDLDLLVPRDWVAACRQALREAGYRPVAVEHRAGTRLAYGSQEQFDPPEPAGLPVELHWHLLDVPYHIHKVPVDYFWQRSVLRTIVGRPFRVLDVEANLVYLPAHLALHHQFRSLRSCLDLALLIVHNRERIDWAAAGRAAGAFDLLSAVRATVEHLARRWPSLPLDEARRTLAGLQPSRTDEQLFRLLSTEQRSATLDFFTTLASLPGLRARARYAWFNLFPQRDYMAQRYGVQRAWTLPCWYAVRLAGGLARLVLAVPRARRIARGG